MHRFIRAEKASHPVATLCRVLGVSRAGFYAGERGRHGGGAREPRGRPRRCLQHIRCDTGPELTANALRDFCRSSKAGPSYIEPGSPWQNPYVESFGSRVCDELLSQELFTTLAEAQVLVEDWRTDYTTRRPHSLA